MINWAIFICNNTFLYEPDDHSSISTHSWVDMLTFVRVPYYNRSGGFWVNGMKVVVF